MQANFDLETYENKFAESSGNVFFSEQFFFENRHKCSDLNRVKHGFPSKPTGGTKVVVFGVWKNSVPIKPLHHSTSFVNWIQFGAPALFLK